jgi:hypothetical protein
MAVHDISKDAEGWLKRNQKTLVIVAGAMIVLLAIGAFYGT